MARKIEVYILFLGINSSLLSIFIFRRLDIFFHPLSFCPKRLKRLKTFVGEKIRIIRPNRRPLKISKRSRIVNQSTNLQVIKTYNTLVIELFRVVDSSAWNMLADIFHLDIVYERPGYKRIVGIDQLLKFYQTQRVIASGKHHIEHIVVEGNYGACWGRFIGFSKDNFPIDELFADVYSFENGLIKTRKTHFFRPAV